MKCPACQRELEEMTVDDITVDVCRGGCGGIWFDRYELRKLDEPHESGGESLLDVERDASIELDHTARRWCPKCDETPMLRHFFSVKRQVEVDECPRCAGYWLDEGELGHIRTLFQSEDERHAAAEACFDELFGNGLAALRAQSAEKTEKAREIAKIFRFISPSYYVPGKQDGGAF